MADGIFKRLHEALGKSGDETTFTVRLKDPSDVRKFEVLLAHVIDNYRSQNSIREKIDVVMSNENTDSHKVTFPAGTGGYSYKAILKLSPPSLTVTCGKPIPKAAFRRIIEEINEGLFQIKLPKMLKTSPRGIAGENAEPEKKPRS